MKVITQNMRGAIRRYLKESSQTARELSVSLGFSPDRVGRWLTETKTMHQKHWECIKPLIIEYMTVDGAIRDPQDKYDVLVCERNRLQDENNELRSKLAGLTKHVESTAMAADVTCGNDDSVTILKNVRSKLYKYRDGRTAIKGLVSIWVLLGHEEPSYKVATVRGLVELIYEDVKRQYDSNRGNLGLVDQIATLVGLNEISTKTNAVGEVLKAVRDRVRDMSEELDDNQRRLEGYSHMMQETAIDGEEAIGDFLDACRLIGRLSELSGRDL